MMRLLRGPAARQAVLRLTAVTLALLPLVACSSDPTPVTPPTSAAEGAAAATSPVAELQAGLTAVLVERVYLVAATRETLAGPRPEPARRALDAGSVALADVIGATYSAAREPVLEALRAEDELLARHAEELADGDSRATRERLEGAQEEVARVLRQVVPTLDISEVADRLDAALQAQLDANSYDRLCAHAREAEKTARLLTDAIADDRGLGSASTRAVRLRGDLTGLLTEHTVLVPALARELRTPGPAAQSAAAALDTNAQELAALVGDLYPAAGGPFLRSWTAHLDRLQRYAAARVAGRDGAAEAGLVAGYPAELARLLAENVRGLPAQSIEAELVPALRAQLAAVDEAARGSADAPAAAREAVVASLQVTALLSSAVAEDLRLT